MVLPSFDTPPLATVGTSVAISGTRFNLSSTLQKKEYVKYERSKTIGWLAISGLRPFGSSISANRSTRGAGPPAFGSETLGAVRAHAASNDEMTTAAVVRRSDAKFALII